MTKISRHYHSKGYVLRSGGADGADSAFERGAGDLKEIYPIYRGIAFAIYFVLIAYN